MIVGFVDHGLRKGVDAEWELVKKATEKLNIRAEKLIIDSPLNENFAKDDGGVQQWARMRRYSLLEQLALKNGISCVLTAHTIDDQAETVMLRLLRGAGVDGLGGIPRKRRLASGVVLIRPFLSVGRQEIRSWLVQNNIAWAEDPSNKNLKFMRVKVREKLLPLMNDIYPGITGRLFNLAEEAEGISNLLNDDLFYKNIIIPIVLADGIKVLAEVFSKSPMSYKGRIVRYAIKKVQGNLRRIERVHIDSIVKGLSLKDGTRRFNLPGETEVFVSYGALYVFKSEPIAFAIDFEESLKFDSNGNWKAYNKESGIGITVYGASDLDLSNAVLSCKSNGKSVENSSKKFKTRLIDAKIPLFYRSFVPNVSIGKNVLFAPFGLIKNKTDVKLKWHWPPNSPLNDLN
jgi:tRNA(Ile)-lysidine synthase